MKNDGSRSNTDRDKLPAHKPTIHEQWFPSRVQMSLVDTTGRFDGAEIGSMLMGMCTCVCVWGDCLLDGWRMRRGLDESRDGRQIRSEKACIYAKGPVEWGAVLIGMVVCCVNPFVVNVCLNRGFVSNCEARCMH